MNTATRPYRYLNLDGLWPGFNWDGLELDSSGVLRLMALPRLEGTLPTGLEQLDGTQPAAGVAVDIDGTIYFSRPGSHGVYRIDGCTGEPERVACIGGNGPEPGRFAEPAGLVIPRHRRALYVADSGNGRIQIVDLETFAVLEILTGFDRPIALASDDDGNLYVLDAATRRVDQLTMSGDLVQAFWDAVQSTGRVSDPRAVACDGGVVYVLDGHTHRVSLFDRGGRWLSSTDLPTPGAAVMTVCGGAIYIANPDRRRIAVLRRDQSGRYVLAGDAAGFDGPVAAMCCHPAGGLVIVPGGGFAPLTLTVDASYKAEGWLHSGAVAIDDAVHYWNRLHALVELPEGSHVQFFVHAGAPSAPPPPASSVPTPGEWRAAASDAADFFLTFDGKKTQALWIAVRFTSELHTTPALAQVRIDFDQDGYLEHLPAIYRERDCGDLLLRYLSLFESFFRELEGKIEGLPAVVDPEASDADALPWLATFLALPFSDVWDEADQRAAIGEAYERYARRGTVAGLLESLRIEAGVRAAVDEPIQAAGWWAMPGQSTGCRSEGSGAWIGEGTMLGFNTVLAGVEPQGAVVGTSATLDASHLIAEEEFGMPTFDAVAHRFTVLVYPRDAGSAGSLERIRGIVDREKPAHTAYEVCILEPGIRVGYRARLGVDTLLGRPVAPGPLGEGALVLAGDPPSQLGVRSHLGVSTHL